MLKASCGMASVKRVCVPVVPWRGAEAGKGRLLASAPPDIPVTLCTALSQADID